MFGWNYKGATAPDLVCLTLDGTPCQISRLKGLFHNPQFVTGFAITALTNTIATFDPFLRSKPAIATMAFMSAAIVASHILSSYFIEQHTFGRYPKLENYVINTSCKHKTHKAVTGNEALVRTAQKVYQSRMNICTAVSAIAVGAVCIGYKLNLIELQPVLALYLSPASPVLATLMWSWRAKRRIRNQKWTLTRRPPNNNRPSRPDDSGMRYCGDLVPISVQTRADSPRP